MTKAELHRTWYQRNKDRIRPVKRDNMRRYRRENPAKHRAISRKAKSKLKDAVFFAYGTVCVRCEFSDRRALTLDHRLNNGAQERKTIGERGVYLRALIPANRNEYQILCMNCQFIKRVEAGRQNQWLDSHGKFSAKD